MYMSQHEAESLRQFIAQEIKQILERIEKLEAEREKPAPITRPHLDTPGSEHPSQQRAQEE